MPDWSYRTFLRPLLFLRGGEAGRRTAVRGLSVVARIPGGPRFIDFLGHMRADERLRTRFGDVELAGPIALSAEIDPHGDAIKALERFGVGMIEVGPVTPENVDRVERNIRNAKVAVCVRTDDASIRERLRKHAACFTDEVTWLRKATVEDVKKAQPSARIIAGGVREPADAKELLDAGAHVVAIDDGLLTSGPGLAKRCNEALLSEVNAEREPEAFGLDAARSAWFWAFLLGVAMFGGGLLAIIIASTRVVLPYDERWSGMTRAAIDALNPRLIPFMAHDRVSLAGTMMSVGIFYAALAWSGIRRGAHWAHVTVIKSALVGFFSFFFFLGFGYFDPFHAFVTAILTQFTVLCMVLPRSPRQPAVAEWRESAAWRRGQWGQLLFILIGVVLTGAGVVISIIGCTSVFVKTDLDFMRTTAKHLEHLTPLIAHDRASLGGMLIANGVAVWLSAQWGFRAGAGWLWRALACGGNIAFAAAVVVHIVVGYGSLLHLTPAFLGWLAWNVALALTHGWLCGEATAISPRAYTSPSSAPQG
ncbi:MAG TPA: hypothetical protein VNI54_00990 [Thermoanaerobaculia bacterium]|nr:hypothetical protein [Thermoanaerobaculia bacterium]